MSGRQKPSVAIVAARHDAEPRPGGFAGVVFLKLPEASNDWLDDHAAAVALAEEAEADWLVHLAPGESLAADAFELIAPALDLFDAIFGAAHVDGSAEPVSRLTRLAFDTGDRLPHALLNWWLPRSIVIRTSTAKTMLARAGKAGYLGYLFDLWDSARCQKSAQPLLLLDREPEPIGETERGEILARLDAKPVFLPIVHGKQEYFLPYTGLNAGIEREQSRGLFFEAMELEDLRKAIGPGARIVDVGANTGNHTVFFAGPMRAASVIAIEPLPPAIAALRASVARNRLANVDLSKLGIGVSNRSGRAKLVSSARGGLGATSLESDPDGDIAVEPLDALIDGRVDFLKIDVEGMELRVLSGSRRLIERSRPVIFIEIANRNTVEFTAWLEASRYRVARIFTDKRHTNYLLTPEA